MSEIQWWHPATHAARRPILLARNRIQAGLRLWLDQAGFVEVDPAGLQVSPGNEAHLHGFATAAIGNDGVPRKMYLHTSPEFAMKKLLAAGEQKIASFAHVWRNRERGARHAPEFTMLEWYRVGADYSTLMADCTAFLRLAAGAAGVRQLRHGARLCNPFLPVQHLSVAEAFQRFAGIDILATLNGVLADAGALAAAMDFVGIGRGPEDTWSDMFSRILSEKVEPQLGVGQITVLDRYPAAEAALARRSADDPRVAERFEVYACGVELANGFGELTDAAEQRRRFQAEMAEKQRVYGETYPIDEDFLAALALMPAASGCALGFDRLVMLATGAPRIDDVQWVPVAG